MKPRTVSIPVVFLLVFSLLGLLAAPTFSETEYAVVTTDQVKAMIDQKTAKEKRFFTMSARPAGVPGRRLAGPSMT